MDCFEHFIGPFAIVLLDERRELYVREMLWVIERYFSREYVPDVLLSSLGQSLEVLMHSWAE